MDFERRSVAGGRRKKRSKAVKLFVACVFAFAVGGGWYVTRLRPVDAGSAARVTVTVPSGAGLSAVADDLEEKGLVRSSFAFAMHARWNGQDRLIRAGTYVLRPSMGAGDILDVLTGGEHHEVSVTIPEGYSVADIDRMLAARGLAVTGAILECSKACEFDDMPFLPTAADGPTGRLEGYLFPDTYFVGSVPVDPQQFLHRMLSNFQQKVLNTVDFNTELHDQIVMASLIEKEAANDAERAVISGILWKRYFEGITLGVDASVRYALGKPTAALTREDLAVDSPYNLRTRQGLPPGPIANPGLASIEAALHPEETPYYYYLHGTDGQIRYARTNDEHNANKAKYLR